MKKAEMFFEYKDLGKMGVFIEKTLKLTTTAELAQLKVEFSAANGCWLSYPAVPPFETKRVETDWTDEDGGYPLYSVFTYDAFGGIVAVKEGY